MFKTMAMDSPGGNLSLVRNIKAITEHIFKKYSMKLTFRCYTCNIFRAIKVLQLIFATNVHLVFHRKLILLEQSRSLLKIMLYKLTELHKIPIKKTNVFFF